MYPAVGTRLTEYFELFRDTDLLTSMVKLETIRMACIPTAGRPGTLLGCVQRVRRVEQLSQTPTNRWLTFRFVLEVEGVAGNWQRDIPILVQTTDQVLSD